MGTSVNVSDEICRRFYQSNLPIFFLRNTMRHAGLRVKRRFLVLTAKCALEYMRQFCGNCCGKAGHRKAADFLTAVSLDFKM
jgi:hypothetical protein